MPIERRQSVLWGKIPLKTEILPAGSRFGVEDTWHDWDGAGRWRYYGIEVTAPDSLRLYDKTNTSGGSFEETLSREEINNCDIQVSSSCLGSLIGYSDRCIWVRAENDKMAKIKGNGSEFDIPRRDLALVQKENLGIGVSYLALDYLSNLRKSDDPDLTLKKVHSDALAKLQLDVVGDTSIAMHKAAYIFLTRKARKFHIRIK